MNGILGEPLLIDFSLRAYRLLVGLYPASFRRVYGPHMQQVFRDCCRRAWQQGGIMALLLLWGNTLFDILKTLVEEHLEGATDMNESKFIRLSGMALLLGGLSAWLAFIGITFWESAPGSFSLNQFFSPENYQRVETSLIFIFSLGFFLLAVGLYGLYRRLKTRGSTGINQGLLLAAAGAAVCCLGALLILSGIESGWTLSMISLFILAPLGLAIFGASALSQDRGNSNGWIAILASIALFLAVVSGEGWSGQFVLFSVAFLCLAALGLMQVASPLAQPEAAV